MVEGIYLNEKKKAIDDDRDHNKSVYHDIYV